MVSKPELVKSAEKIKDSAARVKASTSAMEGSAARMEDSADRRTVLAADRTVFASERTYAAWVRTGLVALASGVGAKALLEGIVWHPLVAATGTVLILFSGFCFWAAVWRQLNPGPPPPTPSARRIYPALLIIVNSFLGLVALAALVGIWFGRPHLLP
jgi:putative membrane protein